MDLLNTVPQSAIAQRKAGIDLSGSDWNTLGIFKRITKLSFRLWSILILRQMSVESIWTRARKFIF